MGIEGEIDRHRQRKGQKEKGRQSYHVSLVSSSPVLAGIHFLRRPHVNRITSLRAIISDVCASFVGTCDHDARSLLLP